MMIYLICLVAGLVFTFITVVAGHFFGGGEAHVEGSAGHAEAGADSSDMPGMSIFSPTVLATFITAFGGFGIIFSQFQTTAAAALVDVQSSRSATIGSIRVARNAGI